MGVIPWPPPVADMAVAYSAEDHLAANGADVLRMVTNKVTGTPPLYGSPYAAENDPGINFAVFTRAAAPVWPDGAVIACGHTPSVDQRDNAGYAVTQYTDIAFMVSPVTRMTTEVEGFATYIRDNLTDALLADGYTRRGVAFNFHLAGSSTRSYYLSRAFQPWTMYALRRDNTKLDPEPWLEIREGIWQWFNIQSGRNPLTALTNVSEMADPGLTGCVLLMRWNRPLSDEEITAVYDWGATWLPTQEYPQDRAQSQLVSTTATTFLWDMAHGPATIECSDGRIYADVASGFVDLWPVDTANGQHTFRIAWADNVYDPEKAFYTVGNDLGITAQTVNPDSATFIIPAAQTFDIIVYRDGVMLTPWPAGQTTYADGGLEPAVTYHYDFQEEASPTGDASHLSITNILTPGVPSYATAERLSTFTYSLTWDAATYGPADIACTDGRTWQGASSPFVDMAPVTPDAGEFGYTLTWADSTVETYTWPRATPVELPITATVVTHNSATFDIAPQGFDLVVYRDGLAHADILAGAAAWVDSPLNPDTPYAYRFEQAHTEALPATGYALEDIRTRAVSAPASEYWVSRGGAWVKASEAYGAHKGEWVPLVGTDTTAQGAEAPQGPA